MEGGNRYRLWLIGGALAAVALLAVGWLVFISPQYGQTSRLRNNNADAQTQLTTLRHTLSELGKQNSDLARYEADLARDRAALPGTAALSDFLRELQSASDASGVAITPATFGQPAAVTGVAQMYAIGTNLTATGTLAQVVRFLNQLQQIQPRAVLISNASITADKGSVSGKADFSAVMQIFVSTAAASALPSASASASASSR